MASHTLQHNYIMLQLFWLPYMPFFFPFEQICNDHFIILFNHAKYNNNRMKLHVFSVPYIIIVVTLSVGTTCVSWTSLPVMSTVRPSSSKINGVGLSWTTGRIGGRFNMPVESLDWIWAWNRAGKKFLKSFRIVGNSELINSSCILYHH